MGVEEVEGVIEERFPSTFLAGIKPIGTGKGLIILGPAGAPRRPFFTEPPSSDCDFRLP